MTAAVTTSTPAAAPVVPHRQHTSDHPAFPRSWQTTHNRWSCQTVHARYSRLIGAHLEPARAPRQGVTP